MTLIIGFGNKARHGKDSAANAIKEYYDTKLVWSVRQKAPVQGAVKVGIFKFATALYQEVNEALAQKIWVGRQIGNHWKDPNNVIELPDWVQPSPEYEISELAPYGKHPKLLQWWGTEYRRAQDPDYWVNKLFATIPANLDIALVTDVRFPNEADGIKQRGGYTVNVQRLREDGQPYVSSDRSPLHPSETALDGYNWDHYIKTKNVVEAGEIAITITEFLRGLNAKR